MILWDFLSPLWCVTSREIRIMLRYSLWHTTEFVAFFVGDSTQDEWNSMEYPIIICTLLSTYSLYVLSKKFVVFSVSKSAPCSCRDYWRWSESWCGSKEEHNESVTGKISTSMYLYNVSPCLFYTQNAYNYYAFVWQWFWRSIQNELVCSSICRHQSVFFIFSINMLIFVSEQVLMKPIWM